MGGTSGTTVCGEEGCVTTPRTGVKQTFKKVA